MAPYMMVVAFSNASRVMMSRVRAPRCSMRNRRATAFLQSCRGMTMACEVWGCKRACLALLLADAVITARIDSRHGGGAAGTHAHGL